MITSDSAGTAEEAEVDTDVPGAAGVVAVGGSGAAVAEEGSGAGAAAGAGGCKVDSVGAEPTVRGDEGGLSPAGEEAASGRGLDDAASPSASSATGAGLGLVDARFFRNDRASPIL